MLPVEHARVRDWKGASCLPRIESAGTASHSTVSKIMPDLGDQSCFHSSWLLQSVMGYNSHNTYLFGMDISYHNNRDLSRGDGKNFSKKWKKKKEPIEAPFADSGAVLWFCLVVVGDYALLKPHPPDTSHRLLPWLFLLA